MTAPAAPLDARSASTKALDTLLLFAEHDFECDWFRYDSEGFHRSCSCGRDEAVEGVRACLAETAPVVHPAALQDIDDSLREVRDVLDHHV